MENFTISHLKNHLKMRDWKWLTKIICFMGIIILVVTDQMVKLVVSHNMIFGLEYSLMPGFINLKYTINPGSAFSLFQNQQLFLIIFAFFILTLALIWWLFTQSISRTLGLTFIIAGVFGNLIDRFLHDGVIDFLAWQLFPPYTIFNTADIFITVGIIIIIVHIIIESIHTYYQEKNGEKNDDQHSQTIVEKNKH